MRAVTIAAIFGNITMFVCKGAAFLHVAARAHIARGNTLEHAGLARSMGIVAIETAHLAFPDRMMGKQVELGPDIRMAAIAELGHFVSADLLLRSLMELVARETTQIIECMNAGGPVCQDRHGCSRMALEADQRLCLRWKMVQIKQF